ncbi:MAG: glycosyltransferase family 2 protein [Patescibacteria group bacterium]
MKKRLSVVLAVYNEEANLKNCLDSVRDIAWEIVVVDGGSKDNTLKIAESFGAKIIRTTNPANFHINKNKAIDMAAGEWILQLDADEVVTKALVREIEEVILRKSNIEGFWIPRKNFFLGRFLTKGGQYPDYTLRLYKRGFGRFPAKDVHEQAEVKGKVEYFRSDLLHMRDKTFSIYMERFNRYTDFLSVQINNPSFFDYFFLKPGFWFIKAYIRHKGFMDGFPGFLFALFSSLRFPVAYIKYLIDFRK